MLKSVFVEESVADETVWHKRLRAPWFATTIDGASIDIVGQIWRRKRSGKWEYRQEAETPDEFESRAI